MTIENDIIFVKKHNAFRFEFKDLITNKEIFINPYTKCKYTQIIIRYLHVCKGNTLIKIDEINNDKDPIKIDESLPIDEIKPLKKKFFISSHEINRMVPKILYKNLTNK